MKTEVKTKEQLISELAGLRQRLVELETAEIRRKRADEALQHRIEFERLITSLSTSFINLPTDQIDDGINVGLQQIGKFARADRSYVFLFYDNLTKMENTHEWCSEGVEPQIQNSRGFLVKDFPWCDKKIKRFETIHVPRVADLPPEAVEKEIFQSQQIQSLIVVPMVHCESLHGFVGFDSVHTETVWSQDIIMLLRIVGEIFANALERKRTEEALIKRDAALKVRAHELAEVNTTLRVLLKQRDKDRRELEEKVLFNVRELVVPYAIKLQETGLDAGQLAYLNVLESNLNDIISPFARNLSLKYLSLTPAEILTAHLVKSGKTSKEIAALLNVSPLTVESRRKSIRMKIGIRDKKASLRSQLLSI